MDTPIMKRCCLTKDGNTCTKPGADNIVEVTTGSFGAMCTYHANRFEAGAEVNYDHSLLANDPNNITKEVNTLSFFDKKFEMLSSLSAYEAELVSTQEPCNGYRLGLIDYALEAVGLEGIEYALYSLQATEGGSSDELKAIWPKLGVDFAVSRDVNEMLLITDRSQSKFCEILQDAGFSFVYESKFEKRANVFTRPAALFGRKEGGYRLLEIDQDTLLKMDQHDELENLGLLDETSRILDGMIIGRKSLLTAAVNETKDTHLAHLPASKRAAMSRRLSHPVSNFRLINPGGFWKGQIFWIADKAFDRLYGDYDFVQMSGETKAAIAHAKDGFFLADPQRGHSSMVLNIQSMCNRRFDAAEPNWMFDSIREDAEKHFEQGLDPETGPEYLFGDTDAFIDLLIEMSVMGNDPSEIQRLNARGVELLMRGINPRAIPDVMNNALNFERRVYRANGKPKIPTGAAGAHIQIISDAAARMAGWDGEVARGTIVYWRKFNVAIVSSVDYVASFFANSGGCDHDDFFDFVEFTSTVEDRREVVVWRNPSTMREYSVFTIEGDWPITKAAPFTIPDFIVKDLNAAEADGEKIFNDAKVFWKLLNFLCPAEMHGMKSVKFLGDCLRNADAVAYAGTPEGTPIHHGNMGYYTEDFFTKVKDRAEGEGTVDEAVATSMNFETTLGPINGYRLCPMEDKVDAYVQGGAAAARKAISEETQRLLAEVCNRAINEKDVYIDNVLAQFRKIDGIYYSTFGARLPAQAKKKYRGKLSDPINVEDNTWFGHFENASRAYLQAKTKEARKIVSDTCVQFVPSCIKEEGSTYYGFDGYLGFDNNGDRKVIISRKSNGKGLPADLTYGAAGLLRKYRLFQKQSSDQMKSELAGWRAANNRNFVPKDVEKEFLDEHFDRCITQAEHMFYDSSNWDPTQCVDDQTMLNNTWKPAANKLILEAREGALVNLDLEDRETLYRFTLALARACYTIPTGSGMRSFAIFQSDNLWKLLMEAITYFDADEYIDPEQLWS